MQLCGVRFCFPKFRIQKGDDLRMHHFPVTGSKGSWVSRIPWQRIWWSWWWLFLGGVSHLKIFDFLHNVLNLQVKGSKLNDAWNNQRMILPACHEFLFWFVIDIFQDVRIEAECKFPAKIPTFLHRGQTWFKRNGPENPKKKTGQPALLLHKELVDFVFYECLVA